MIEYYHTLGVSKNSTIVDIKRSYKKLAMKYHPDHNGGDSTKFLEIQKAYKYLILNHKKHQSSSNSVFKDMFQSMRKEPIKNHVIRLSISLKEALGTVDKTLTIKFDIPCDRCSFITRDYCKKCGGVGYIKEEKLGIFSFKNISHQNQTYVYKNYYKGINLHIKVNVTSDGEFYLKKDIIYVDVPLNIFKAILGGTIQVITPRSTATVGIPEGKIKDFSCCLKEKGLTGKDLIINFKVFLPKDLTLRQKKLLNSIIDENKKK